MDKTRLWNKGSTECLSSRTVSLEDYQRLKLSLKEAALDAKLSRGDWKTKTSDIAHFHRSETYSSFTYNIPESQFVNSWFKK